MVQQTLKTWGWIQQHGWLTLRCVVRLWLLCVELCAALFRGRGGHVSPGLPWGPPAACCACCTWGPGEGVAVRLLLRIFSQALGSDRALIKYTGIGAVVAIPQLLGLMWGTRAVLNHPWAGGAEEAANGFLSGLQHLVGPGLGYDEEGLRRIPQLQLMLWPSKRSHSGHISLWSNFVQGGRKHRLDKMR